MKELFTLLVICAPMIGTTPEITPPPTSCPLGMTEYYYKDVYICTDKTDLGLKFLGEVK